MILDMEKVWRAAMAHGFKSFPTCMKQPHHPQLFSLSSNTIANQPWNMSEGIT
ncbi:hypothetical protein AXF42_Ash016861 [Apostasia shenzhenica]|uniref:Uncharacterized protein n=1 Tax=Apostasia shenzhenica TaxID=1088818 RepID=A0A2I0BAL4_9ASPA|nr:hypothetical protein AXF42_Ash016861 [Apostasia shenzhenica]